jgi:DNA-binding beta-propeller fold protein YncE
VSAPRWMLCSLAALGMLGAGAPPAGAAVKLGSLGLEFGSGILSRPNGMAVDQATGNVYVADHETNVVDVFGPEGGAPVGGGPSQLTGAQAPAPFSFGPVEEPVGIAVDNSGGPSNGDVYVVDLKHGVVDKFRLNASHEYEYLCQLTGPGNGGGCHRNEPQEVAAEFGEPTGVAVDSHGNVYVSDYEHKVIDEFNAEGDDIANAAGGQIKETPLMTRGGHPAGLAIDAGGDLYVKIYEPGTEVLRFTLNSLGEVEPGSEASITSRSKAITVDPSTSDLYIDEGTDVLVYNSQLELQARLDLPSESEGIAINGATHDVYISDAAPGRVEIFGPVTVPDAGPCETLSPLSATGATLRGTVDPLGTEGASYHFQYGTSTEYGFETPPTSVEGNVGLPVEAPVVGLEPGTTYHCRLDATNNTGLVEEGHDSTFTTPPLKPVVEDPEAPVLSASNITTTGVIFNGQVDPGNGATAYHFAYGEESENYTQNLPSIGIGSGLAPIPVEQAPAQELRPNTTYHFALIATNAAGTTVGLDHTFTTLALPHPATAAPVALTGEAAAVTQSTAMLTGAIDPGGLPTTYAIELGATTAYGTRIFGALVPEPGGVASIASAVSGLQPAAVYHFRVVAFNAAGTSYGADHAFATEAFPTVIVQPLAPLLVPTPTIAQPKASGYRPKTPSHKKRKRRRVSGGRTKAKKRRPKRG